MMHNDTHGDETYTESTPLEDEILRMQDQINDLQWRMNALCAFLSMRYPDAIEPLELAGI